ncbi:DNA excision repair protein ERCC-5 [Anopheles nili]|uniref:DNA excision repair protein ERCC-5 n=1 Tax=Anopheles nili TaxID=185578 RepID=UPI00237B1B0E|nr:DNA excision repair protein ERCC-5 [Anopheles nili]
MGVLGLWKLIEQSGKPIPLDTLENKVLAVDISIWLHQVIKGFQDSKGSALPNAHVLGLFHRLCKLMYYRIKPIFVFDGGVPILKKQTIAKRNQSKNNYQNEADRIQQLLLETLAKEKVVQQALGSATNILISPSKKAITNDGAGPSKQNREEEPDAMFKLPPLKAPEESNELDKSDSSMDEKTSRNYYHLNLNAIDVTSIYFKNLPADVRHEILNDIKETRKQSSWGRLHELPVESNSFSSFQMNRLLKRRQVQVELEEAEKEMGGKCLSLAELESLMNEEGIDTSSSKAAQKIASDENTRFLLVRDVQKAIEKAKAREEADKLAPKPPKLAKLTREEVDAKLQEVIDDKEMDEELQLAIKMSLMQDENPHAMIDLDDDDLRMSREQKQALGNAAQSLARGFMLEYGGLTTEEFNELLHQTQDVDSGDVNDSMSQMFVHNEVSIIDPTLEPVHELPDEDVIEVEDDEKNLETAYTEAETESDSDFIDVPEDSDSPLPSITLPLNATNHFKPHYKPIVDFTIDDLNCLDKTAVSDTKKVLEVVIKQDDIGACDKDDIFADIFTEKESDPIKMETNAEQTNKRLISIPTAPMISIPSEQVKEFAAKEDNLEMAECIVATKIAVPKAPFALKIKNVDDINAQLKEELENLKKRPQAIDLGSSSNQLVLSNLSGLEPSTKLETINEMLKQQLEDLKLGKSTLNLDEIKLDAATMDVGKGTSKEIEDHDDSDTTIIYDADDADSGDKIASETEKLEGEEKNDLASSSTKDDADVHVSDSVPVIEILDSPHKKGTLEHLVLSRTPGKDSQKQLPEESIPYVPQPFFVNKTPTKSPSKEAIQKNETEKANGSGKSVSKELFPPKDDSEPKPSTSKASVAALEPKPVSAENLITEMADTLKESHTTSELYRMALDLEQTERELEREKNKQSRLGVSITDQMRSDCMELLQMFGVPYIVAPMEAEAQCAFLNQIEMTDGTITDDSDIWLFGGQRVYKNFFNQQKLVFEFTIEGIEKMFHMDRKKLIQLALLVGSDYTTGIHGIGAVTALEILASFPPTPEQSGETTELMSMLSGLRKFRDWWQHGRNGATGSRMALKSKLKNIDISEGFPSSGVVDAYLRPTVDCSEEQFTWGYPDAERLRDYACKKFGWTVTKTNDILLPVLKRLDERKSQTSIKNFFKVQSAVGHNRLKVSKRVQHAVDTMAGKIDPNEEKPKPKKKTPTKPKQAGSRKRKETTERAEEVMDLDEDEEGKKFAEKSQRAVSEEDEDFILPKKPTKKTNTASKQAAGTKGSTNKPKRSRKKASTEEDTKKAESLDGAQQQSETDGSNPQRPGLANIAGIIANINQHSAASMEDANGTTGGRKKRVGNKIPDFNPAIPQRVKDEQEMVKRKQRAAELFKKLKAEGKSKRK